ncbi:MAG: GDSL-type esterase/lipase family protein [Huintestinicola sp.]
MEKITARLKYLACILAAAALFGCAKDGEAAEKSLPESSSETESVTVTSSPYGHDIDFYAEQNAPEIAGVFFSSLTAAEKEFYPNEKSVSFSGRHIEYDGVQYLSYTCSSIDFVITGDRIEADMVSNGHVFEDNQQGWAALLIDGELVKRFRLDGGENTYVLYEGDMLYNAKATIIKLSENQSATVGVKCLRVNARKIAPAYKKEKTIEFIGDSLTCGYGNEGTEYDNFDTAQENGMETYAYLTAKALDMECSMVCISGVGIVSDYTSQVGDKEDYLLMPENYDCTDMNFQMRRGFDEYEKWDFGGGSDIVVINLGTNDVSYTGSNTELMDEFGGAYYDFIGQVRRNNPDAEIICTLGIVGSELFEQIEYAAKMYSEDNFDDKIHTFKFSYMSSEDGYGADYHPTVAAQRHAAEELTEYIQNEIIGS